MISGNRYREEGTGGEGLSLVFVMSRKGRDEKGRRIDVPRLVAKGFLLPHIVGEIKTPYAFSTRDKTHGS